MKTLVIVTAIACVVTSAPSRATEVHWIPAHHLAPQGMSSNFASADLDADSDYDISMFDPDPVHHYWNAGTPQSPQWELDTTQFTNVPYCQLRDGALGDLDDDGDVDLVVGCLDQQLRCYWNVGSPQEPVWQFDPVEFENVIVSEGPSQPYFADLDSDGDLDLTITETGGAIRIIENTGTPTGPEWTHGGWIDGVQIGPASTSAGAFGDVDGDGDLDLVGASWDTPPQCWENVGTPELFEFVENTSMLIGVDGTVHNLGVNLLDIDADGDLDLMISSWPDNRLYLNEDYVAVESTTWTAIKALFR